MRLHMTPMQKELDRSGFDAVHSWMCGLAPSFGTSLTYQTPCLI